jgi:hypothetical protein
VGNRPKREAKFTLKKNKDVDTESRSVCGGGAHAQNNDCNVAKGPF